MSQAIFTGPPSQTIGAGITRLGISAVDVNSGITVVGNTFQPGTVADFYLEVELYLDSIRQVRSYTIDLFNETTSTVVQRFKADAESAGIGDFHSFIFALSVADATHFYSLRITPTGGGPEPRLNIIISRTLIAQFGGGGGGGTVGPGTVGRVAKFTGVNAVGDSSVNDTGVFASKTIGLGRGNVVDVSATYGAAFGSLNLIGTVAHQADYSSAFGYYNKIAQGATAYNASAFGYKNRISQVANTFSASAVGNSNRIDNATYGSAFGRGSYVGSTSYTANKSSAFGYANRIGQTANSNNSSAVGYKNTVDNAANGNVCGAKNLVGSAAFTATKSSAFGYGNQIGQSSTSDKATAVGYKNYGYGSYANIFGSQNLVGSSYFVSTRINAFGSDNRIGRYAVSDHASAVGHDNRLNAPYSSAFGAKNIVGSAAYTAEKSSAFGYGNLVAQAANANNASAVGRGNSVNNAIGGSVAIGAYNHLGTATFTANSSSALGRSNNVGIYASANSATAVGNANIIDNSDYGFAVGSTNSIGYTGILATKSGAVGYHNRVGRFANATGSVAFGYYNFIDNTDKASAFGVKNIVGSAAYTATKSSVVGYGNQIGQTGDASYGVAVGLKNKINNSGRAIAVGAYQYLGGAYGGPVITATKSSGFGYYNTIGSSTSCNASLAAGAYNFIENGINISAVGTHNSVGSAAYTATKSSAFGYGNIIAQTVANCDKTSVFGYKNTVENAAFASVVGYKNTTGPYICDNASVFGRTNQIGQTAVANKSSAFGFSNTINNSLYGLAVGAKNIIGYGATASYLGIAVGYVNKIGTAHGMAFGINNTVLGTYGMAFGNNSRVTQYAGLAVGYTAYSGAPQANAIGFKSVARIAKTTNIAGPLIIRKDNAEAANIAFETFCGAEVILYTKEIDLTAAADQTITLPVGCKFFPDEVGIIETAQDGSLTSQAFVHAGITGTTQKLLANTITTLLTAVGARQRFQTLLSDAGETSIVLGVATGAVLNTATVYKGRMYVKGHLVEDE